MKYICYNKSNIVGGDVSVDPRRRKKMEKNVKKAENLMAVTHTHTHTQGNLNKRNYLSRPSHNNNSIANISRSSAIYDIRR